MGEPNTVTSNMGPYVTEGNPTFLILDLIVALLGGTNLNFWPFLNPVGGNTYPYGAGSDGVLLAVNTSTLELIFDPRRLPGGIHAYMNDSATANLAAADSNSTSFGDAAVDSPVSMGLWILPQEALGTIRSLIAKYNTTGTLREYDFRFDATGQLILELYDESVDTTEIATAAGGGVVAPWVWNHVVATYDGGETDPRIHLYINGVDQNAAGLSVETGAYVAMENGPAVPMVGARNTVAAAAQIFQGCMALPFITGKELTAAEVKQLYTYGKMLIGLV